MTVAGILAWRWKAVSPTFAVGATEEIDWMIYS